MPNVRQIRRSSILLLILVITGCNSSRYGLRHDEILPHVKRVEVVPLAITVVSRHTGSVPEARPDVSSEVLPRLMENLIEIIKEKGFTVSTAVDLKTVTNDKRRADAAALAAAVQNAIMLHHYDLGKNVYIDYSLGEAIRRLGSSDSDVVVLASLQSEIPTAGRVGLAVTAFLVGVVTGVNIHVSTNEAFIQLMLVNRDGEVLWYNQTFAQLDVRSKSGLRRFVKKSTSHLLKPYKKKRK